jgi:hypothetical protein
MHRDSLFLVRKREKKKKKKKKLDKRRSLLLPSPYYFERGEIRGVTDN